MYPPIDRYIFAWISVVDYIRSDAGGCLRGHLVGEMFRGSPQAQSKADCPVLHGLYSAAAASELTKICVQTSNVVRVLLHT